MQKTYVMLKPDTVERKLVGEIISRFEKANLNIVNMKMIKLSADKVAEHYDFLVEKPFYPELRDFMTSGPVVAMIIEGENAIAKVRELMGPTNFANAEKGTIRGDFANNITKNLVHGSDAEETAAAEIKRFFGDNTEVIVM